MGKLLLILMAGMLAGCATEGKLRDRLQANIGHNIDEVIARGGAPVSITPLHNGDSLYSFHNSNGTRAIAGMNYGYVNASAFEVYCDIRYVVAPDGTIKQYSYYGNSCRLK